MRRTKHTDKKKEFSRIFNRRMHSYFERQRKQQKEDPELLGRWLQRTVFFDANMRLNKEANLNWLYDELQIDGREIEQKKENLRCLIANLLNQTIRPIQVSKNRKNWINQYNVTTFQTTEYFNQMQEQGYIEQKIGFAQEGWGRQTRIWATEKLLERFTVVKPSISTTPKTLVELRRNGKPIPYTETLETERVQKILSSANKVNAGYDISCGKWKIHPTLTAIYINDFAHYGRIHSSGYRHFQGLEKNKQRPQIQINGEPCLELDYSALHPTLLYAAEGIELKEDPYNAIDPNPKLRGLFKGALLRMINADRGKAAQSIYADLLSEKYDMYDKLGYGSPVTVIDKILECHVPISKYLLKGGDAGLRLMNKDAKICLNVIRQFSRKGWPILPIHDSFITLVKYRSELEKAMQRAYQQNNSGFSVKIREEWSEC